MALFEVILKGYDPLDEGTHQLLKWIKCKRRELLEDILTTHGVMSYVRSIGFAEFEEDTSFEDGLDAEIYKDNSGLKHIIPSTDMFGKWIAESVKQFRLATEKMYKFKLQPHYEKHMCCIENRNTDGCDRIKLMWPDSETVVGYVFPEHSAKVPPGMIKEYEYIRDRPEFSEKALKMVQRYVRQWLTNMGTTTASEMSDGFDDLFKGLKDHGDISAAVERLMSTMFDADRQYDRWAFVRVTQLVHELSDPEDRNELPAGSEGLGSHHDYPVPCNLSDVPCDREKILDWFHLSIAIGCLDDFEFELISVKKWREQKDEQ